MKNSKKLIIVSAVILTMIVGAITFFNKKDSITVTKEDAAVLNTAVDEAGKLKEEKLLKETVEKESIKLDGKIEELKNSVTNLIGSDKDKIGFSFLDINSEKGFDINGDKKFAAASTVKVPINMVLSEMLYENEITLDTKLKYTEDDYEEGAGVLQGSDTIKRPIAIRELMKYSIENSDNIATQMLLRTITENRKCKFLKNITGSEYKKNENLTSANDSKLVLLKLYKNEKENAYLDQLIEFMKNTEYHDRLDKEIPKNLVAHKIGDYKDYINDIGIVYKDKPYIITCFTKGMGEKGRDLISKISKLVYEFNLYS